MTELELRQKVADVARSYLGIKEGSAEHKRLVDIYNAHEPLARGYKLKYTDAWCAGFVSVVAILCGLTDIIPTEVSCPKMIGLFKKMGRFVEADDYAAQVGNVIFYDWQGDGSADHVGIVVAVTGTVLTVVEGNYSNAVKARVLAVDGKYIRGYGVPDYAGLADETDTEEEENEMRYKTIEDVPEYARPTIQRLLDADALLGKGGDEGLDLTEDMVRILVILDRKGVM